jgi:hypothetical protein
MYCTYLCPYIDNTQRDGDKEARSSGKKKTKQKNKTKKKQTSSLSLIDSQPGINHPSPVPNQPTKYKSTSARRGGYKKKKKKPACQASLKRQQPINQIEI